MIHNFFNDNDETFIQACENCAKRVIGSSGRKKHERKYQDLRVLITIYCTVYISVMTVHTIFLVAGNKKRVNYTDKFLQDNGASPGSNFLMTPAEFMTEE